MARINQRLGLTRYEADEYYKQALVAYHKKKLDEAILAMDNAISLLPNHAEYYAARGFFCLQDGIEDRATADFEQALRLYPYEVLAHYGRGVVAYGRRNWDEALAHFNDAYRANPNRAETLYYLALTHHRKGNNVLALTYMQQAVTAFEAAEDKRQRDAERWVRELQRLVAQERLPR
ncbi:tetratricopeptide repeat protein [bacterium]|nr:tetratricopeptide repeat protein [bacterium]